ncbi:MAG: hypothetical protein BroJett024_24790 [Alphaproteobacteria bacterium]|nr:MAG: hypothetical protein BroJett024_24790 [Alphaproteobacteria bacterium]
MLGLTRQSIAKKAAGKARRFSFGRASRRRISKDEVRALRGSGLMVRDALLRNAPHHEAGRDVIPGAAQRSGTPQTRDRAPHELHGPSSRPGEARAGTAFRIAVACDI